MAAHETTIELQFESSLIRSRAGAFDGDIVWRQTRKDSHSDRLKIIGKRLRLTSVRSRRIRPEDALNQTSMQSLRTAMLYVAVVGGGVPRLHFVTIVSDKGEPVTYGRGCEGPAARLFEWERDCQRMRISSDDGLFAPAEVARVVFRQTLTAKAARVSASFLAAAMQAVGETDRLRYLWSAYNPLYQLHYYLQIGEHNTSDSTCLCELRKRIRNGQVEFKRAEARFSELDHLWLADRISWGLPKSEWARRHKDDASDGSE